jgi:hypothetical protein
LQRQQCIIFIVWKCHIVKQSLFSTFKTKIKTKKAEWVHKIYSYYSVDELNKHPAVIILPYSVMSYRITELYALKIPLFIPSLKFYRNFYDPTSKHFSLGWDRTSTKPPYCNNSTTLELEMRPNVTSDNLMTHPYSPNIDFLEDAESEMYWLQFSDFYEWPYIHHFDDFRHLKKLLLSLDVEKTRRLRKKELELRQASVVNSWCNVINRIGNGKQKRQ